MVRLRVVVIRLVVLSGRLRRSRWFRSRGSRHLSRDSGRHCGFLLRCFSGCSSSSLLCFCLFVSWVEVLLPVVLMLSKVMVVSMTMMMTADPLHLIGVWGLNVLTITVAVAIAVTMVVAASVLVVLVHGVSHMVLLVPGLLLVVKVFA